MELLAVLAIILAISFIEGIYRATPTKTPKIDQPQESEDFDTYKVVARTFTTPPKPLLNSWIKPKASKSYKSHAEYIASEEWQQSPQRLECLRRAANSCEMCGVKYGLEVHHIHYRNFGNETPDQLVYLCCLCHDYTHEIAGKGAVEYPPLKAPKKYNLPSWANPNKALQGTKDT